jgi:DNA-binding SARP family transcriptional activator
MLFVGEPLAGSDYGWAGGELRRLRATHIDLLEGVARRRLEAGEARAALDAAERGLELDALNESLWRVAMEAENALGLREAVAERYERLRSLLDERLGLQPARETRHLHRNLLAQD